MKCPICGGSTKTYGTRPKADGSVLRYRRCHARGCWLKFQTTEELVPGEGFYVPLPRGDEGQGLRRARGCLASTRDPAARSGSSA